MWGDVHVYRWLLAVLLGALLAGCGSGASKPSSATTTAPTVPAATGPVHPQDASPKEESEEARSEAEENKEASEEAKKRAKEAKKESEKAKEELEEKH